MGLHAGLPLSQRLFLGLGLLVLLISASQAAPGEDEPLTPPVVETPSVGEAVASLNAPAAPLPFVRVHVPPGRVADVSGDGGRYIPMALDEFEEAVRQLSLRSGRQAGSLPRPAAERLRYEARLDEAGWLRGQISFEVSAALAGSSLPLGEMPLRDCRWQAARKNPEQSRPDDAGEALEVDLCGLPDGSLELSVPGAGRITALVDAQPLRATQPLVQAAPLAGGQPEYAFQLPLVPALATTLVLDLPAGLEPRLAGSEPAELQPVTEERREGRRLWQFTVGPRAALALEVAAPPRDRLTMWSNVGIGRRASQIETVLLPETVWNGRTIPLRCAAELTLSGGHVQPPGAAGTLPVELVPGASGKVSIKLPVAAVGTDWPLRVRGVIAGTGLLKRTVHLPGIGLPGRWWAGGGMRVQVDSEMQLAEVDSTRWLAVPPTAAVHWPGQASALRTVSPADDSTGGFAFEQQQAGGGVTVAVAARQPEFDIARVTTVDVTTAALIGRAACDIRIRRGSVHRLEARIGPEWLIDAVEPLLPGDLLPPADDAEVDERLEADRVRDEAADLIGTRYEWKVVRGSSGDRLILDLPVAVTPARDLRLRISGHRRGVPAGGRFQAVAADMVQLEGEASGQVWIDLRTSPETTLVADAAAETPPPFDPRLTLLAEAGAWRQRVPAGRLAPPCEFVFLRRRPPLKVEAQTRLTIRGEQVSETFSFTCQPQQGELDALTVHFSEAVGDLDWSLLTAGETTVFARRQEAVAPPPRKAAAPAARQAAGAWLIELTPPVTGTTTIRATASRPFTGVLPVPLAWVEAAEETTGRLVIQSVGQDRPHIRNARLRELPANLPGEGPLETLAEFAYDKAAALAGAGPAAELEPLPAAERPVPRCWIWHETTTVRCAASATAEYETSYALENDGRASVLLTVPASHRLLGVTVNGERLPLPAGEASELPVYLPDGQRRVRLVVRSVSMARPSVGLWRLTTDIPTLDTPTLTRQWQMLLPAAVRMVAAPRGFRERNRPPVDWIARLLGAAERGASPGAVESGIDRALTSRQFVPVAGRYRQASFLLIDSTLLASVVVLVAVMTAAVAALIPWTRTWLLLTTLIAAAVAALWVPEPADMLARAVLWGGLGVTMVRLGAIRRAGQLQAGLVVLCAFAAGPALAAEQPVRVFLTPVEGETTALVPESLFRVLATTETGSVRSGVRILDCRVEVMPPEPRGNNAGDERWWINLLVESDAATVLPLDQAPTESRYADRPIRMDGGVVRAAVSADRRRLTVSLPAAGRHLVAVPVEPARTRWGDLEVTELRLPISPATTLLYRGGGAVAAGLQETRRVWCEQADRDGQFRPAEDPQVEASGGLRYRLATAERVRLVRTVDPQTTLMSVVREASSLNQIAWREDDCRLTARFSLDPGKAILPTLWLQADPRLVPLENAHADQPVGLPTDYELSQVAPGVFRVDRRSPVPGPVRLEIPFTMPLNAVVGDVALPDVWLRGVQVDHRETVLEASGNYRLAVAFPGTVAPPQIEERVDGETTLRWSTDVVETLVEPSMVGTRETSRETVAAVGGRSWSLHRQPVRLTVTRQPRAIRGRQQLVVAAGQRATTLVYEADLDVRETVWMDDRIAVPQGFEIESCQVFRRDRFGDVEGTVDLHQRAAEDGSQVLVLQQPAAGHYLLRVEARRNQPLPNAGRLPLIQSTTAAPLPMTILWEDSQGRGQPELLAAAGPAVRGDSSSDTLTEATYPLRRELVAGGGWRLELPAGVIPQRYRFRPVEQAVPLVEQSSDRSAAAPPRLTQNGAELVDLEVVIDERGRISGVGRYDLITRAAELRLRLPDGFRLFEVLLDGRQVQPVVPGRDGPADVWTIPLRSGPWPHELLVVFVGELGDEVLRGEPVAFGLPALLDLPVARRLVSIDSSSEQRLLVGGGGQTLSAAEATAVRAEAEAALAEVIGQLAPDASSESLARLRRFREHRAVQLEQSPLEAWASWGEAGMTLPEQSRPRVGPRGDPRWQRVILAGTEVDQTLTVRFASSPPAGLASVGVTLVLLLIGMAGWWLLTRRPARCLAAAARWWPVLAAVVGIAWLGTRVPVWPGGGLVLVSGWVLGRRWLLARVRTQSAGAVHDLETVSERQAVSGRDSSVTRTAAGSPTSSTITHHPAR